MLSLADHWIWDSWLALDDGRYHLFFLRASRALADPVRRHLRASIGHAVSDDLRRWELQPDAMVYADGPAFDDQALWTGSVAHAPDGRWLMFYTGISRADGAAGQRIGLAVSDDLGSWRRAGPGPLLEPDPRWYDQAGAWRDPYVFADPDSAGWHMLIAADSPDGPPGGRAVVGYAWSADLARWEVRAPLSHPAGFGEIEVPQAHLVDGRPVLLFSCRPQHTIAPWRTQPHTAGAWTVTGDVLTGPWDVARAVPFHHPSLYGARLVADPCGGWSLIGFRDTEDGVFHGELLDPIPVSLAGGRLVTTPQSGNRPDISQHATRTGPRLRRMS